MPNQYGRVEKIARVCEHCGATFHRYPSQLIGAGQGRFCSRSCMASSRAGEKNSCWRGGPDTRSCERCGAAFRATPANPQRFCSKACADVRRGRPGPRTAVARVCAGCGVSFLRKPSAVARGYGKFCSRVCMRRYPERISRPGSRGGGRDYPCKQCGKVVHDQINTKTGGRKFCSQQCRANYWGPRWRGAGSPCWKDASSSGRIAEMCRAEYKDWRKAVYERDDYTCQRCKRRGGSLQAHHKRPWAQFPGLRYAVENGETLCVECHRITHMSSTRSDL